MRVTPIVANACARAMAELAAGGSIQLLASAGGVLSTIPIIPSAAGSVMRCAKASGEVVASGSVTAWRLIDRNGQLLAAGEQDEIALTRNDLIRGGTAELNTVELTCG